MIVAGETGWRDAVRGADNLLVQFDDLLCRLWPPEDLSNLIYKLQDLLLTEGVEVPLGATATPVDVLRFTTQHARHLGGEIEQLIGSFETSRAPSAKLTRSGARFLAACVRSGSSVVLISNWSGSIVRSILENGGHSHAAITVVGRETASGRPADPVATISRALEAASSSAAGCVLIASEPELVRAAAQLNVLPVGVALDGAALDTIRAESVLTILFGLESITDTLLPHSPGGDAAPDAVKQSGAGVWTWIERAGFVGTGAALVISAGRAGYASLFQASIWEFGLSVQSLLLSSALVAAGVLWLLLTVTFVLAATLSGRRYPAYLVAGLALAVATGVMAWLSEGDRLLGGDFNWFARLTCAAMTYAAIAAWMSGQTAQAIAGVRQMSIRRRRAVIAGVLYGLCAWEAMTFFHVRWWFVLVFGTCTFLLGWMTVAVLWYTDAWTLYTDDAIFSKYPRSMLAVVFVLVVSSCLVIAVGSSPPTGSSPNLLRIVLLLAILSLAVWLVDSFPASAAWVHRGSRPPLAAIGAALAIALLSSSIAAYYGGQDLARSLQTDAYHSERGPQLLGFPGIWVCPMPTNSAADLFVEPILLVGTAQGYVVAWSEDGGTVRVPTNAFVLRPLGDRRDCT